MNRRHVATVAALICSVFFVPVLETVARLVPLRVPRDGVVFVPSDGWTLRPADHLHLEMRRPAEGHSGVDLMASASDVQAPVIHSISPNNVAGGAATLAVSGSNFRSGLTVMVTQAGERSMVSPASVQAVTSSGLQ